MRLAIIADPIDNQKGGVHVYTREMVRALLADPRDLEIILIREKKDPGLTRVRQIAIPNIRVGMGLAALRLFFVVPLVLWWHRVDAVLEPAHFGPFNLPSRIKRITMIHDLTPILLPQYHRFHSQLLQRLFLKGILRRADLILANSNYTAADIARYLPEAGPKTVPILLGYDPVFKPAPSSEWLDASPIATPYFLTVGTIEPRKNLLRLLEAYTLYRREGGTANLVIAGQRGWKADPFYEALDNHPYRSDIHLTGYVPDEMLAVLYTYATALVYPSEYEGFGLPVLEAFACGCPVLCSGVTSLPEVGGDVAQYVDPSDTPAIAAAMIRLDALPHMAREDLKMACMQRAARFSWEAHVMQFHQALARLRSGPSFNPIGEKNIKRIKS
jgi:glycosyltransferase involved in cell wall biosynthesis